MSTPRCCGTLTTLKATLNHAFDEGLVKNNNAWGRRLKPFLNVDVARIRYLTVDEAQRLINPNDLFEQAQSAEEAGDLAEAERLYRILMKCDPMDASAPFNLGNLLRACTRNVEAEAAFRAATRTDPTFADAWYNLSDLLDEQGRVEAAIECLRTALKVAPDYADAMFNLALLLQRTNQYAEAADCWRRYLASDRQSEWASRARRSLKFCEMQVRLVSSHS
jgi:tetratricopeptide (TPR) repeat protein